MRPLLLLPLLVGCGTDPACEAVAGTAPSVTIGTGTQVFAPVADGATVELERGFQGGIHVYGALRTAGLAQDPSRRARLPIVTFRTLDDGVAIGGFSNVATTLQPIGDGVLEGLALQAVFDSADPTDVIGQIVTLHAEVRDFCSRRADADVSVEIVDTDTGF